MAAFALLSAPSAKALVITGTAQLGQVLTGAYVYADDVGDDAEDTSGSGSSFRFVKSIDNDVSTLRDNTVAASGTTGGVNKPTRCWRRMWASIFSNASHPKL